MKYFSVVIPFTYDNPTLWHPTDEMGPLSTLTRGVFPDAKSAHRWAVRHLDVSIHKYSVREYDAQAVDRK